MIFLFIICDNLPSRHDHDGRDCDDGRRGDVYDGSKDCTGSMGNTDNIHMGIARNMDIFHDFHGRRNTVFR